MKKEDFPFLRQLAREMSGISLTEDKAFLVESRLEAFASREGVASVDDLIRRLRQEPLNGLHQRAMEALANHETLFFRDIAPFEILRRWIVPEILSRGSSGGRVSVWSAACSFGQEPYSVAMLLREHFPALHDSALRLVASDFSTVAVERAASGRYSQLEINRGLPAPYLLKYFEQHGLEWQLRPEIRRMVEFERLNLLNTLPAAAPFDIILLRNMLIYLDLDLRRSVLGRIRRALKPDGFLFLGISESTFGIDDGYSPVAVDNGCYYRLRPTGGLL